MPHFLNGSAKVVALYIPTKFNFVFVEIIFGFNTVFYVFFKELRPFFSKADGKDSIVVTDAKIKIKDCYQHCTKLFLYNLCN